MDNIIKFPQNHEAILLQFVKELVVDWYKKDTIYTTEEGADNEIATKVVKKLFGNFVVAYTLYAPEISMTIRFDKTSIKERFSTIEHLNAHYQTLGNWFDYVLTGNLEYPDNAEEEYQVGPYKFQNYYKFIENYITIYLLIVNRTSNEFKSLVGLEDAVLTARELLNRWKDILFDMQSFLDSVK